MINNLKWIDYNKQYYQLQPMYFTHPWDEFSTLEETLVPKLNEDRKKKFSEEQLKEIDSEKTKFNFDNEMVNQYYDWHNDWLTKQPEYKKLVKQTAANEKEWDKKEKQRCKVDTFCGEKLNKPGTLIELDNGKYYLIGNVIPSGCMKEGESDFGNEEQIPPKAIVVKYCNFLSKEILNLIK